MRQTPSVRKRLEDADRKIHEYLERKLMAEHAETDEQERPGISGGRKSTKPATEVPGLRTQTADNEPETRAVQEEDRPGARREPGRQSRDLRKKKRMIPDEVTEQTGETSWSRARRVTPPVSQCRIRQRFLLSQLAARWKAMPIPMLPLQSPVPEAGQKGLKRTTPQWSMKELRWR